MNGRAVCIPQRGKRYGAAPGAAAVGTLILWLALPAVAAAQATPSLPPVREPQTHKFHYSAYEEATIAGALSELGFAREDDAEGKLVESIHPVRLEVIEERDPAPRFLNVFHVVTRSYVSEREILLRPGDAYRQTLADETRRNLGALPQLSLVLVVAAKGSAPDRARIVVITKDVWSLRLNWNIALTSSGLEGLTVNPSETNLLGTQQTLGLQFSWLPQSYSLGGQYAVPRVLGSHVAASADAGLIFNRASGAREGSFGDAQVTYPLWSSRAEWSWGAGASWLAEVTRLYSGGRVASFTLDPQASCGQPSSLCVPWAYLTDVADGRAFVTRSFGWAVKHDVSVGFEARKSRYRLPDLSLYDPATVQAFDRTRVPLSDDRVGPFVEYSTYSTDFLRILDLESLALQEDYRLGPQGYLLVYPVLAALGSSRSFVGLSAGLAYTGALADGLARGSVDSTTEVETDTGNVKDGSLRTGVRVASPRFRAGRVVLDAVLQNRYANRLNRLSYLGGDSRLRGYPSQYFVGSNLLGVNAEYRSRPWQFLDSLQLGGVLFYDAGDAFDRWKDLRLRQAAGFGARVLFPQLDRIVFRADVGFPLARTLPPGVSPVSFFVTFGQAFSP